MLKKWSKLLVLNGFSSGVRRNSIISTKLAISQQFLSTNVTHFHQNEVHDKTLLSLIVLPVLKLCSMQFTLSIERQQQ